ncbi:MAG TPA: carboxypeptidase regulatory-like domain-containing protein [Bryobacteraceae bacterium]|nr:carboxypeptidase regulatory-like domain-containing protein [Bryobacteraceae bacterium]
MLSRVALVLCASVWTLPALAQNVSIAGRVINQNTGAPLRDATVLLFGPFPNRIEPPGASVEGLTRSTVATADRGEFTFRNVAPGNYELRAAHNGFEEGGEYYWHPLAPELLALTSAQPVKGVVIKLAPLGVIAGKVVDETGAPLAGARITVWYAADGEWARSAQPEGAGQFASTNDLGEYRVARPQGAYIISAAYPFGVGSLEPDLTPGTGHPVVYYPNASGPDKAQFLTVASGKTVKADFTLKKGPACRVNGYLTGDQGRVLSNPGIGIVPKGSPPSGLLMVGSISTSAQDGSFSIVDLPPGAYTLTASTNNPLARGVQDVDVLGNLDGLKIRLELAKPMPGMLTLEGDVNLKGTLLHMVRETPLEAAGAFTLTRAASTIRYRPELNGLAENAYVKSLRYGGAEIGGDGFWATGNGTLEITISSLGAARLTGTVRDASGRPVRYPWVTVVPSDGGPAASAKGVLGDAEGKFVFEALRPGSYTAAAWAELVGEVRESHGAAFTKLYRERGKAVAVASGTPASVTLTLIPARDIDAVRHKP